MDEKNGAICLVIMFTPGVMVIKMLKMAYFLYFLLMTAKNQFRQNIYIYLEDLFWLLCKILLIIEFWATISKMSTLENTGFGKFFADSAVLWYSYPQYLPNGNSNAYQPCYFLQSSSEMTKNEPFFFIFVTVTPAVNMITR